MAAENHHATIDLAQKNQMTKSPNLNLIMAGEVMFSSNSAGFSVAHGGLQGYRVTCTRESLWEKYKFKTCSLTPDHSMATAGRTS